jgi:hypothetical protein
LNNRTKEQLNVEKRKFFSERANYFFILHSNVLMFLIH